MGIIAESWRAGQSVQLKVHRLTGVHRALGVIALGTPPPGEALLFRRCRSVHGMFMRCSLDVVFLDAELRVLRVARLRPWGVRSCRDAVHTIEMASGECARLNIAAGTKFKNILF